MMRIDAILSLLAQDPVPRCARRHFRDEPVLAWTLRRVRACADVGQIALVCWEDQVEALRPIASAGGAYILAKSPRCELPLVSAIAAARRWCDGWRGALMGACCFDTGFHGGWMLEAAGRLNSEAILLVDPDAGLVDAALLSAIADHARQQAGAGYIFSPAAPGLGGALVRVELLKRLAETGTHLGRLLGYWPGLHLRDPIALEACAPAPLAAVRTCERFTLDSRWQIVRMEEATQSLNGSLPRAESIELVRRAGELPQAALPRDIVLELSTDRSTRPIFSPRRYLPIERPPMSREMARQVIEQAAARDDARLTLAGVGDPLLNDSVLDIIEDSAHAGLAVHVETDLLADPALVDALAGSAVDVISVHLPALTRETYAAIMGTDALARALENVERLLQHHRAHGAPLVVPTFIKCRDNLHEMEGWYDQWLVPAGSAVIASPSCLGGRIADVAAADMSPPGRVACRRLASRLVVRSDGSVTACEEDVLGEQALGRIGEQSLAAIWQEHAGAMRRAHAAGEWDRYTLCRACREWHRP